MLVGVGLGVAMFDFLPEMGMSSNLSILCGVIVIGLALLGGIWVHFRGKFSSLP